MTLCQNDQFKRWRPCASGWNCCVSPGMLKPHLSRSSAEEGKAYPAGQVAWAAVSLTVQQVVTSHVLARCNSNTAHSFPSWDFLIDNDVSQGPMYSNYQHIHIPRKWHTCHIWLCVSAICHQPLCSQPFIWQHHHAGPRGALHLCTHIHRRKHLHLLSPLTPNTSAVWSLPSIPLFNPPFLLWPPPNEMQIALHNLGRHLSKLACRVWIPMGRPYASTVSVISFISPCQTINYTSSLSVSWWLGVPIHCGLQWAEKKEVLQRFSLPASLVRRESFNKGQVSSMKYSLKSFDVKPRSIIH